MRYLLPELFREGYTFECQVALQSTLHVTIPLVFLDCVYCNLDPFLCISSLLAVSGNVMCSLVCNANFRNNNRTEATAKTNQAPRATTIGSVIAISLFSQHIQNLSEGFGNQTCHRPLDSLLPRGLKNAAAAWIGC